MLDPKAQTESLRLYLQSDSSSDSGLQSHPYVRDLTKRVGGVLDLMGYQQDGSLEELAVDLLNAVTFEMDRICQDNSPRRKFLTEEEIVVSALSGTGRDPNFKDRLSRVKF